MVLLMGTGNTEGEGGEKTMSLEPLEPLGPEAATGLPGVIIQGEAGYRLELSRVPLLVVPVPAHVAQWQVERRGHGVSQGEDGGWKGREGSQGQKIGKHLHVSDRKSLKSLPRRLRRYSWSGRK